MIKLRTHIGFGSPNKQDSHDAHGSPLGEEEVALTKERFGWDPEKTFYVPEEAETHLRREVKKGETLEAEWKELLLRYRKAFPEAAEELDRASRRRLPESWPAIWSESLPEFDLSKPVATREAQGRVLDALMPKLPLVIGGSADLTPSNNTRFAGVEDFSRVNRKGRYMRYGVREHGMGAIMNGIAVSDLLIPYGATFFVFSDYMRPTVRLAALSRYPTIFVYTHDSIGLGEDGPTHQAVEQLASLRAMPNLVVLRPADAYETAYSWKYALENREGPTVLALTRQKLPVLDQAVYPSAENVFRGAYTLVTAPDPRLLLLATGSEVHLAMEAYEKLGDKGVAARVISMPSWELFEMQPEEYRESVIPSSVTSRIAVEAGVGLGWERYTGQTGAFVGMRSYGASAPYKEAYAGFGITVEQILGEARKLTS